jgi:hypothetical protein
VRRWGLRGSLALALLLIPAPSAFAASCTATNGGAWLTAGTWSCHSVPGAGDAVVIPAGTTVTIAAAAAQDAATVTLRGTLALSDADSSLAATNLIASGGTISGPASLVTVTLDPAVVTTVDAAGLTVSGASLQVAGSGGLGISGPLTIVNGGWFESDVGTNWTGTAPWQLGGGTDPAAASGFEVAGAQLTVAGATSAQAAPGAGNGVIQLDQGATLSKQDATTTRLAVDVLLDNAFVQVIAGRLIGGLQGNAALSLSSGAALGLSGDAVQLVSTAVNVTGGTLEVEPGADVGLDLPANPGLRLLSLGAGAALDVGVGIGAGAINAAPPTEMLAAETALAAGATLSIDGGGGTLALADQNSLHGSGTLDGSLANTAGTLSPSGALHVTGDFSQAAGGTLALALRSAADGDALTVDGAVALAGTLRVTTTYAPAAAAAPLVLGAADTPTGTFAKTVAPVATGRVWEPAYGTNGVTLALAAAGAASGAAGTLSRPSLRPKSLAVGGTASCVPPASKTSQKAAYQWLRAGKRIRGATRARYLVRGADRGRQIACRVTLGSGGTTLTATSDSARARTVLGIASAVGHGGRTVSVAVRCAASEKTCIGSLRIVMAGHVVAGGRFALHAPGGVVRLAHLGTARIADGAAIIRAIYRNKAGAPRTVKRSLALTG